LTLLVRSDRDRGRQVTISSQLGQQAAQRQILGSHIGNIGNIRDTVHARGGLVRDYPDHETDGADFHDEDGYDQDGYDQDDYDQDDYDQDDYDQDSYGALAWPAERRLRPVAAFIGCVVALGAIATAVVINSGDSASTKATVGAPTPRTVTTLTTQTPAPAAQKPAKPQLPSETVTTVVPPSAASTAPTGVPTAAPPPTALPPSAALNPRTVVYSVTGTKQLFDLVNVVYTDSRGYPHTEFNVALPWSKMIVLNPGVQSLSVVATSIYSHLDCSVYNAAGQTVVASASNAMIATCTR
jgi:hypothetical protein